MGCGSYEARSRETDVGLARAHVFRTGTHHGFQVSAAASLGSTEAERSIRFGVGVSVLLRRPASYYLYCFAGQLRVIEFKQ